MSSWRQIAGALCCAAALLGLPTAQAGEQTVVIAHRGASGYLPEHTLPAYAMAYGMGVDYIEPDVVASRDGVPVVLHDVTLDRTTNVASVFPDRARDNGRFYVMDFSAAELAQMRVVERRTGRFPGGAYPIPRFQEVIDLVQGLNQVTGCNVGLYPEIKNPAAHRAAGLDLSRIVLDELNRAGLAKSTDPVLLQSFDPEALQRVHGELKSELRLIQLIGGSQQARAMLSPAGLRQIAGYAWGIGVFKAVPALMAEAGGNLVGQAHRAGLNVHVWTVRADDVGEGFADLAAEVRSLTALVPPVDGIFSDHPDQVLRAVSRTPGLCAQGSASR